MKVGILGAGQLAQLLAHSAYSLGVETLCYSDRADVPAARNSPLFIGSLDDHQALKDFAKQDVNDEYDYAIKIPEIKIVPVGERESFLSLL